MIKIPLESNWQLAGGRQYEQALWTHYEFT